MHWEHGGVYQSHECITVGLLLLLPASAAIAIGLGTELLACATAVVHLEDLRRLRTWY